MTESHGMVLKVEIPAIVETAGAQLAVTILAIDVSIDDVSGVKAEAEVEPRVGIDVAAEHEAKVEGGAAAQVTEEVEVKVGAPAETGVDTLDEREAAVAATLLVVEAAVEA